MGHSHNGATARAGFPTRAPGVKLTLSMVVRPLQSACRMRQPRNISVQVICMQGEHGDCAMGRTEDKCARSAMRSGFEQARCELIGVRHNFAHVFCRDQSVGHALGGRRAGRACSADTTSGTSAPPVTAATCGSVMPAPCAITSGCAPGRPRIRRRTRHRRGGSQAIKVRVCSVALREGHQHGADTASTKL
jgi:hypothetical protein